MQFLGLGTYRPQESRQQATRDGVSVKFDYGLSHLEAKPLFRDNLNPVQEAPDTRRKKERNRKEKRKKKNLSHGSINGRGFPSKTVSHLIFTSTPKPFTSTNR